MIAISATGRPTPTPRAPTHDTSLSSTTPDVPATTPLLSIPTTLGWGGAAGIGLGALLLRSKGAGFSLGALAAGGWKGAVVGAGLGAALIGIDRLTGGQVKHQLDLVTLDRRSQIKFVLSHPTKPWLASMGLAVARDARRTQEELYGPREPLDGPQDAFRHSYAAALFTLRAIRDHDQSPASAQGLAIAAGDAHEADGQDNNDEHSRGMDAFNNRLGASLAADGRATAGEQADAAGFVTERALRARVLEAITRGDVQMIDRTTTPPSTRSTTSADLPNR